MDAMRLWATVKWVEFKYQCYRLFCAVFGRYNTVVCQSLSPLYNEADELLLHASFQILVDFIEREKPWQYGMAYNQLYAAYMLNTCSHDESVARSVEWENITKLYKWWLVRRQRHTTGNDWDEDSRQLIKLVSCRARLWT